MRYIKIEDLLENRNRWGQGNELWKNSVLKKDFRDFFHNKCWYTEVPLVGQDVQALTALLCSASTNAQRKIASFATASCFPIGTNTACPIIRRIIC